MQLSDVANSPVATKAAIVGGTLVVCHLGYAYLTSPLRSFPGPLLAKFTDFWRVWDYFSTTQIKSHQELHAKYGTAVRIGPNMISVSDPALIKTIYSTRGDYVKVTLLSF
jgi:hypothetical protein